MLQEILADYLVKRLLEKVDADLSALFTGFSTQRGPGAGSELTVQDLFEASADLRTANAPALTMVYFTQSKSLM